jgi:NAD(P)H-dependent flavin oxidoreductase YrpB (nitropropane dioxygenase family)
MSHLFQSKFPILSAPMNKVSDSALAIAVHNAGAFASISAYNFRFNGIIDYQKLKEDILNFKKETGSGNLLLSIGAEEMSVSEILSFFDQGLITHLELICENIKLKAIELDSDQIGYCRQLKNKLSPLKEKGIILILKCLNRFLVKELYKHFKNDFFDGYILKGPDGAGSVVDVNKARTLDNDITLLLSEFPDLKIIASGGISGPQDIKKYLDLGVDSVAVGTLLAMSVESVVSLETKNIVLERKAEVLEKFANSNQRAMIFSKIDDDDYNHTNSLVKGISDPTEGHIFLGTGIRSVKEIRPVKEIIDYLVQGINQ